MRVNRRGRTAGAGAMLAALLALVLSGAVAFSPTSPRGPAVGSSRHPSGHAMATRRMPLATGRGSRQAKLAPLLRMSSLDTSVAASGGFSAPEEKGNKPTRHFTEGGNGAKPFRIVLIAGFETFNRCADASYNEQSRSYAMHCTFACVYWHAEHVCSRCAQKPF